MPLLSKLQQACDLGNRAACRVVARIAASAAHYKLGALLFSQDAAHPNRMPFSGTLVLLDVPSTKPPHGAQGHRILLRKDVAKKRVQDLVGMALNYSPDLEEHAPRRKVGVITKAWIDGNAIKVKGTVWRKDFPEAVKDLKTAGVGMSMELSDVYVADKDADVWDLEDFRFTGATALYKKSAAYYQTALAAQRGRDSQGGNVKKKVAEKKPSTQKRDLADVIAAAVASGVSKAVSPLLVSQKKTNKRLAAIAAGQDKLTTVVEASMSQLEDDDVEEIAAAAADDDEDIDADDEEEIEAAAKDDEEDGYDDDDDDEDDEKDNEDGDEKMEATEEDPDMQDLNDEDVETKTKRTSPAGKAGKPSSKAGLKAGMGDRMTAAALQANKKLRNRLEAAAAETSKLKKQLARQNNKIEALSASVERYAQTVDRKTLSAEIRTLLAKGGHDVNDLMASGSKLTTEAVDLAFKNSGMNLDITTRMALKNQLVQAGLQEIGEIKRFN